ncbi:MAG: CpaF/VirB11 family protein [Actinobacteria bacterium]|nr:CpaF/VirB11 family protein [Actinomycetota bacterium]MCL5735840.1 CpaF/VirB11 family protein [Actinomycetota bacterium]
MPEFERILSAYEHGLKRLADELIAELSPQEEERLHLLLVSQLAQNLVHTYDAFQLNRSPALEASKSVMYAAADQPERRVLNVPLRSLVESNTMTPWHARFFNACLGLKRTLIISGEANVGKSTLLNALIDLLPRDQRVVVIDETEDGLPAVRGRSFTVQLKAKQATPSRAAALRRAIDMKPNWLVVGELSRRDGPNFFDALAGGMAGLATVQTPDPQATMTDWLTMSKNAIISLAKIDLVLTHVGRDHGGRPRVERVFEASVEEGRFSLTIRKPA